jgi:hypothetical protein
VTQKRPAAIAPDAKRECRRGSGLLLNQSDLKMLTSVAESLVSFLSSSNPDFRKHAERRAMSTALF